MEVQMCPPLQNLGNKVLLPDQEAVLFHKYRYGLQDMNWGRTET